jgi:hypothetical protein
MKSTRSIGRFLHIAVRAVNAGFTVALFLLVALAVAATVFVREAATHIDNDPKALSDTVREAVIVTIRDGDPEQKLETIAALDEVKAADAAPFAPALLGATRDSDLRVRQAAKKTLDRIAPDSVK